ncbi:MAG: UDP-2,3-diacylglucosamine diphosphatase [Tahibacter sp.]
MATLFISDLHLEASRPQITAIFLRFLQNEAKRADALYILGDLFESWIGDDDDTELALAVQGALRELTDSGVPVYFMHGNRDFLIGDAFAQRTGVHLLPDPSVIDLYGRRVLLMHGDTLCTDDVAYQAFRQQVREPAWQQSFLAQPLAERRAFAEHAREQSRIHTSAARMDIMDVSPVAVEQAFLDHDVEVLIHGHTHRPAVHGSTHDDVVRTRYVLADWRDRGERLQAAFSDFNAESF